MLLVIHKDHVKDVIIWVKNVLMLPIKEEEDHQ